MQVAKIAKFVAATLGLVATIFAIIQGFRESRPAVPKLQAALLNIEHISSRTEIPDVKISLAFKNQSVSDLWLCRIRFQNIGDVTLYTAGAKPNTQSPIVIAVPEKYEILKIEPKGIDPKDSGFEAQLGQKKDTNGVLDKHQFELMFEQWRKGEAIEAILYLAGSVEPLDKPKLIPKGRPILDGDIVTADLSTVVASDMVMHFSYLDVLVGPWWARGLRRFAFFTIAVIIMALIARRLVGRMIFGDTFERRFQDWVGTHAELCQILELPVLVALYIAMLAIGLD